MMPFAMFEQAALAIPYQYPFPRFLYAFVRLLRPKSVVEVGTHVGATAVWLARALQENGDSGMLYCIDNFCWREEKQEEQWWSAMSNCGFYPYTQCGSPFIGFTNGMLIKGRSQEVEWPARVDFAYIDGNHTYPVVRHDVEKAISLGATLIAMHDTVSCEGSRRYADEWRNSSGAWANYNWDILEENSDCGLMICKKREPKGPCQGLDIGEQWDKA